MNDYVNLDWVRKYSNPVAAMEHCVLINSRIFFFTDFIKEELKLVICHSTGHWLVPIIDYDWPEWEESIWIVPHPLN